MHCFEIGARDSARTDGQIRETVVHVGCPKRRVAIQLPKQIPEHPALRVKVCCCGLGRAQPGLSEIEDAAQGRRRR